MDKFLPNKYTKWYMSIILRAKLRNKNSQISYEEHHTLPKSIGGTNDSSNLVFLTIREHYICHMLLLKMTTGKDKSKMWYAIWCMGMKTSKQKRVFNSRYFENLKIKSLSNRKGLPKSDTHRQKLSKSKTGVKLGPPSDSARANMSKAQRQKGPMPLNQKIKISNTLKGRETWMKGKTHSQESILQMSNSQKARIRKPASKHSCQAKENNKQGQLKFIYLVQSPTNKTFEVIDLKKFCADRDLPYQRLADKKTIGQPIKDSGHIKNKTHVGWVTISIKPR